MDEYLDLHYVVTNTAITTTTAIASNKTETIDQFKDVIDTNLNGVFALNKLAINYWEEFHKPGSIVNVSNILGLTTTKGLTSYRVCQGGVQSLTQSLALAYANKDIRLNSVIPGYVKISPMLGQINQHIATTAIKQHPMARWGTLMKLQMLLLSCYQMKRRSLMVHRWWLMEDILPKWEIKTKSIYLLCIQKTNYLIFFIVYFRVAPNYT